jgi:hypothetical protein
VCQHIDFTCWVFDGLDHFDVTTLFE